MDTIEADQVGELMCAFENERMRLCRLVAWGQYRIEQAVKVGKIHPALANATEPPADWQPEGAAQEGE